MRFTTMCIGQVPIKLEQIITIRIFLPSIWTLHFLALGVWNKLCPAPERNEEFDAELQGAGAGTGTASPTVWAFISNLHIDVKGIGAQLSTAGRLLAWRCTPTNATFWWEKKNPWGCHCCCPRHPSYFGDATTSSTRRPQKMANRWHGDTWRTFLLHQLMSLLLFVFESYQWHW